MLRVGSSNCQGALVCFVSKAGRPHVDPSTVPDSPTLRKRRPGDTPRKPATASATQEWPAAEVIKLKPPQVSSKHGLHLGFWRTDVNYTWCKIKSKSRLIFFNDLFFVL